MHFSQPLIRAEFRERPNRFLGIVELRGSRTECFIPNPGRMGELLYPRATVYLSENAGPHRRTDYDLTLVDLNGNLVSIDSRVPNTIVEEAIELKTIEELKEFTVEKREFTHLDSRLDFYLKSKSTSLYLEVKSCTLVRERVALFPDAPTKRGSRHLKTLTRALNDGRGALIFVIQRTDAEELRPNGETDPEFAHNLNEAAEKGVEVYAYTSNVSLEGITLKYRIPVIF